MLMNRYKFRGLISIPKHALMNIFFQIQSAYGLGLLLFPNSPEMQLGLFFTGASPAGGASNTWTVILGGNLDLSITMSTTSTLSAFGKF